MRVCLVSFEFPPGGGGEGTYTRHLLEVLLRSGHSVALMTPLQGGALPEVPGGVELVGVKVSSKPLLKVASFCVGVKRTLPVIAKKGLDVAHLTFDYPSIPVDLSGCGVPVVATAHHLHFVEAQSLFRVRRRSIFSPYFARQFLLTRAELSTLGSCSGVIAVSDFTRRSLINFGVPARRVRVVPNGIDHARAKSADGKEFRRSFGLGDAPYALYVGRLDVSKGLEYLISAFGEVTRAVPKARLVIVGKGPPRYADSLRRRAGGGWAVFTGFLNAGLLRSAYEGASLVVLPSLMEGSGISLLEGMAAAKPCVATRVGGVPEVVQDGTTGLLVEPGESRSLSAAITRVLGDRAASKMGERGRLRVVDKFGIAGMSEGTLSAYEAFTRSAARPA